MSAKADMRWGPITTASGIWVPGFARTTATYSAQHFVFLEPGGHLVPAVLGGFLAVARAIVGVEAVRCARIDLELGGLAGRLQCGLHRLDLRYRNALVGLAVKAEHRRLHLRRQLGRALRPDRLLRVGIDQRAVERNGRLEVLVMRGIFPHRAPAATEAHDAEPA